MRPGLRVIRDVSIGILTVWAAEQLTSRIVAVANRKKSREEPDVNFSAESVDLSHFQPVKISYKPKNIYTEAVQATPENIGKLSLEFEEELFYDAQGRPYFYFSAERFDSSFETGAGEPSEVFVRLMDWIVPLRGELHIYRDVLFQHTFTFDNVPSRHDITLNTPMLVPAIAYADTTHSDSGTIEGSTGTPGMSRTEE